MKNVPNKWVIPAEINGWELWQRGKAGPTLVGHYEKLPSSAAQARFYMPVASCVTKLDSVFIADSEMELASAKMNFEVEFKDGQDTDAFKAFTLGEKSYYTGICVDALDAEKNWINCSFDFIPRLYKATDEVILLKEQGRWVMMCYLNGAVVHAQVIGKSHVEELLGSHLVVLRTHLQMLGLQYQPEKVIVLSDGLGEIVGFQSERVQREVLMENPEEGLTLIPQQIQDWQRQKKASGIRAGVYVLLLLAAIAGIGFMFWQRYELQQEIVGYEKIIEANRPMVEDNNTHSGRMRDLKMVENPLSILEMYSEYAKSVPGVRQISTDIIEITPGRLEVKGRAKTFGIANIFKSNLEKNKGLLEFEWEGNDPKKIGKTTFYEFSYEGKEKVEQQ